MEIPVIEPETVVETRKEFESAVSAGGNASDAGVTFCYALVHSRHIKRDVDRGIELAQTLIEDPATGEQHKRELLYLIAVGKFRRGKYLDARNQLNELLKVAPEANKARALKQTVEDQIVKEGLIGVGVVGGALGLAALVVGAFLGGRR